MDSARNLLQNIFFDIGMVINRHTSAEWRYIEKKLTYYNIMFVYDGEGVFIRNDEKRIVRNGDFVFYRSGDSRSISTNPDRLLKCYGVNFTYTVPIFSNSTGEWSLEHEELPIDFITNIKDEYIFEKLMSLFDKLFRVHISGIGLKNQEERKIFVDILDLYFFFCKKGQRYRLCKQNTRRKHNTLYDGAFCGADQRGGACGAVGCERFLFCQNL